MDRKLFLSYIQNMQQNNADMIGFQNSMTKNSWQNPKSIYEMHGGGHVNQGDFDREDAARQLGRDADEQKSNLSKKSLERIRENLKDVALDAYQDWLENDGIGHPRDIFGSTISSHGKEESIDYLASHDKTKHDWRNLDDDARSAAIRGFRYHLGGIHEKKK